MEMCNRFCAEQLFCDEPCEKAKKGWDNLKNPVDRCSYNTDHEIYEEDKIAWDTPDGIVCFRCFEDYLKEYCGIEKIIVGKK